MDPEYAITYKIVKVGCSEAIRDNEIPGRIELTLGEVCVGDKTNLSHCEVGRYCEPITFYLDQNTANAQNIDWDGTKSDIDRIRRNLEGKIFPLDLGINP